MKRLIVRGVVGLCALWSCPGVAVGDAPPPPTRKAELPRPASRATRVIEGWTVRVDDRLLSGADEAVGARALRYLEAKLVEIGLVVPAEQLKSLRTITIVLDLNCGDLGLMQYHPSAEWLKGHGHSEDLVKCVHLPRAANLPNPRNVNEQPWVILHELAHGYHHQVLGFNDARIIEAYEV